jgi:hypothetical protein
VQIEQEQILQQRLVHDQRRRQAAFLARSRGGSGGSLADSWGQRAGSTARNPPGALGSHGSGRTGAGPQEGQDNQAGTEQDRGGVEGREGGTPNGRGELEGRETLGTEGDEQRRVRQENVEQFVQEQKELLSNLRLESTGARERPEKKARRLQVSVPVGLGPGNVFNVNVDGTEYPVTVPAGTYGGHALQLILEDGGDNRKDDWNAQLQAAARMDISLESALAVAESMLDFFHVPEAQVLACRAVQHILDKSKEGASNETEVERLGLEVRSHFARVNMVIRSHSARVNMVVRSHFARVNRFAHTLRVSTWWRFYSLASDTTSMAAWWTSQRLDHRL